MTSSFARARALDRFLGSSTDSSSVFSAAHIVGLDEASRFPTEAVHALTR